MGQLKELTNKEIRVSEDQIPEIKNTGSITRELFVSWLRDRDDKIRRATKDFNKIKQVTGTSTEAWHIADRALNKIGEVK